MPKEKPLKPFYFFININILNIYIYINMQLFLFVVASFASRQCLFVN